MSQTKAQLLEPTGVFTLTNQLVGVGATFSGNVSIAGTLTKQDVTNVDSVGVITARSGVNVTGGSVIVGYGGAGANNAELKLRAGAGTGNDIIAFLNQAGTTRGNLTYDTDNNFLLFNVNQGEKLRIDSNGYLSFAGDTNTYIHHPAADQLAITKGGGSEPIIRFGTGGNGNSVGINTSTNLVTGSEVLAVRGYASFKSVGKDYAAIYTHNEGEGAGNRANHLLFNWGGANRGGFGVETDNATLILNNQNGISFRTGATGLNGTERFHIAANGNVGISSSIPQAQLDVAGTIINSRNVNSTGDPGIQIADSHRLGFDQSGTRSWTVKATGGNLEVQSGDGNGALKGASTGGVHDNKGNVRSVPLNTQASAYTLVANDAGKAILAGNNVTFNTSVMSAGDMVTIINNTNGNISIVAGAGTALYNTADAATGTRTLATRGMATIYFTHSTTGYISGSGLS